MSEKRFIKTKEQIRAADPQKSVWVTANAGSGKTHVLVERVISLLLAGAEPSSILCITFTKAAASEMSARLFSKMSQWAVMADAMLSQQLNDLGVSSELLNLNKARRLFARALETPGGLKIQTIHAFCEKLLQQFPVEAGVHPGFNILDDRQSEALLTDAISQTLRLAEEGLDAELKSALENCIGYVSRDGFETLMRQFLSDARGLRNILSSNFSTSDYEIILKNCFGISPTDSVASLKWQISNIDHSVYHTHGKILSNYKIHSKHDVAALLLGISASNEPFDSLRQLYLTGELSARKSLIAKNTSDENPPTAAFLKGEQNRYLDLIEKHDVLLRIEATLNLFKLARAIHKCVARQKQIRGVYDFDDLIDRTSTLLNSSKATQWVLYKLDAGLKHILVDEAQDTSPVQWKIISALCEEFFSGLGSSQRDERTLFVVGDRKQSIYSFQGADVRAMASARAVLAGRIENIGKRLDKVDLSISYRSVNEILEIVDTVFPPNNPLRLGFAQDDTVENPHQSSRLDAKGVFELWPLVSVEDEGPEEDPWQAPVDREQAKSPRRILAKEIALKVKSWLGRRVLKSRGRTIVPGDILILFQSRGPLFSMLIAALRKEGIPVAGSDRLRLLESLAVQDLLIVIQWIQLPQDDHGLACLLKSPLVPEPLDEEALMRLAIGRGLKSLWQQLSTESSPNMLWLSELQSKATQLGPYEFLAFILVKFRKAMVTRLGSEALDATDAFLDQVMAYELEHGRSLAGFLHWFQAGETTIKREMDNASGEVRLMTVHGAKGLESNIVILPDAAAVPRGGRGSPSLVTIPDDLRGAGLPLWSLPKLTVAAELQRWKDSAKIKTTAEHNRLLYVAMTRACDELYVCGVKTTKQLPEDSWYALIESAVGPTPISQDGFELETPITAFHDSISPLPVWVLRTAEQETHSAARAITSFTSEPFFNDRKNSEDKFDRGLAIHTLLQELPGFDATYRRNFAIKRASQLGLHEEDAVKLVVLIQSPELSDIFGENSQAEVELRGELPNGQPLVGRVDRIVFKEKEIIFLDYKTDRFANEFISAEHRYAQQMALYAHLLKDAYPEHLIRAALLWTQSAKLEWLSEGLLTQARDLALNNLEPNHLDQRAQHSYL
jgi:ATP-dependent helicase/nuclease subunit A